jgi:HEAT repeat protein
MQPPPSVPSANETPRGLPPVAPPSGRFIVQLFLVPGLIVVVAVLILLGFKFLIGGSRSPEQYLKDLDDPNPEVRWRAASDLAQVLQRPESLSLASDPAFGLSLAERLGRALGELREDENENLKNKVEPKDSWQKTAPRRNYVIFLIACLGNLTTPVGAPLLGDIAKSPPRRNEEVTVYRVALQRRQAILALAKLGDNLKRFAQLPLAERNGVLARLSQETLGETSRAKWARSTLAYLNDKKQLGIDEALAQCADDDDPFLRKLVAFALKYWDGDEVERTLETLSRDDGHGTIVPVDKLEPAPKGKGE